MYFIFLGSLAFTLFLTYTDYGSTDEIIYWSMLTLTFLLQHIAEKLIDEIRNQKDSKNSKN
jgi:hypothetical protein